MAIAPEDILTFWFDEAGPSKWFEKDEAFDAEIRERFGAVTHQARDGKLEKWCETARGCLALIILIDQFSRNIHRGSPLTWSADVHGIALTRLALDKGYDAALGHTERKFLYMPLMHSESKEIHKAAELLFSAPGLEDNYEFELKHKAIIDRFGRYPHRNKVLGRRSRKAEIEFLKEPNSSF